MRSENRAGLSHGLHTCDGCSNVPQPVSHRQPNRALAAMFMAISLSLCGVGSASGELTSGSTRGVAEQKDPGPKPRVEDFADLTEYLLALLRWLYALNGGNPADLDQASLTKSANLVAWLYQTGLHTPFASSRVVELVEASDFLAVTAIGGPGSLTDREATFRASLSIKGAIGAATPGT